MNTCIDKDGIAKENGIALNHIDKYGVKSWIFCCVCDNSTLKKKIDLEKGSL